VPRSKMRANSAASALFLRRSVSPRSADVARTQTRCRSGLAWRRFVLTRSKSCAKLTLL
jgi:hypothetical protein